MGQIFISYAREDKEFVDRLIRDVEADGNDVWIDREDIRAGEDWVGAIGRAIKECSYFVIVITSYAMKSKKVAQELYMADVYEKKIFPLMLQTCVASEEVKLLLSARQWIDFEGNYAGGLRTLLAAFKGNEPPQLTRPPETPTQHPPQPSLAQVLPGSWGATVHFPMMPPFNVSIWLGPDGSFRVQMQTGASVQGRWGINFGHQLVMQGVETFGMMSRPFYRQLTVTQYGPHHVNCLGPQGNTEFWRRFN